MTQYIDRRTMLQWLAGGTLAAAFPVGARAKDAPLRFGIQTTTWAAVAMVAEAEKTFAKAGANVVVDKFDSGAAARNAMIGGNIDVVSIGATPFIIGAVKSNLVAIGMSGYMGHTLAIVASTKSNIKTVADLKGKRVGSQLGSQTDYVFQNKIAPAAGLKKGDFHVVNMKFADMVAALASGSVDAIAAVEPSPSVAEKEGIGRILTDYSKYDIVPVLLATNHEILASREDDLVKFMRGWMLAVDFVHNNLKAAAHDVGNFFRSRGNSIQDEVFASAMKRMDITPHYKPELKKYLSDLAERLVKNHRISEVPNLDRALSTEILKKAGIN